MNLEFFFKNREFESWDALRSYVNTLRVQFFHPLIIGNSKSIGAHNKNVKGKGVSLDTKWKYKFIRFECSHFGHHKRRSQPNASTKRYNQRTYQSGCPFFLHFVFRASISKFVLKNFCVEHRGHPIGAKFIKNYQRKRLLGDDGVKHVLSCVRLNSNPSKLRADIFRRFGVHLKNRDVGNLKQSLNGVSTDEWTETKSILRRYIEDTNNYVALVMNEETSELICLCLQFGTQREIFRQYPEVLQFDGTYRTNKWKLPLYTFVAMDNNGKGYPVCFLFVADEMLFSIKRGLKLFAAANDVSKVKIVITDKDCKEISALEEIFPSAVLLLCLFHVLQIVNRKLMQAAPQDRPIISDAFRTAVYTSSEEEFSRSKTTLCGLGDGLGEYFSGNWFNDRQPWAMISRRHLSRMGNDTNNRIERFHRIMKDVIGQNRRFPQLMSALADICDLKAGDRVMMENEAQIRFHTDLPERPFISIREKFSSFAWEKVVDEMKHINTFFTYIQTDTTFEVFTSSGIFILNLDLSMCTCHFFAEYGLPCRHICFLGKETSMELPVDKFNPRWRMDADLAGTTSTSSHFGRPISSTASFREKRSPPTGSGERWHYITDLMNNRLEALLRIMPFTKREYAFKLFLTLLNHYKSNNPIRLVESAEQSGQSLEDERHYEEGKTSFNTDDMLAKRWGKLVGELADTMEDVPASQYLIYARLLSRICYSLFDAKKFLTSLDDTVCGLAKHRESRDAMGIALDGKCHGVFSSSEEKPSSSSSSLESNDHNYAKAFDGGAFMANNASDLEKLREIRHDHDYGIIRPIRLQLEDDAFWKDYRIMISHQVNICKLPRVFVRRPGRPSSTRRPVNRFKRQEKPFGLKSETERATLIITWAAGSDAAKDVFQNKTRPSPVVNVYQRCSEVNPAIIQEDVNLSDYERYFSAEAWSTIQRHVSSLKKKKHIKYYCPKCGVIAEINTILCDSCLQWYHFRCENISSDSCRSEQNFFCSFCRI